VKRWHLVVAGVVALAVLAGAVALAYDPKVQVRTGERVECTYGHLVSEDIKTISVPRSDASQYGVKTTKIVCPEHARAEQLYDEAQQAIADEDLKTAKKKLTEVVALDPDFKQAQSQLDQIADGKIPVVDGNAGASGDTGGDDTAGEPATPGDDDKPVGPVASLAAWTPDDISGYKADKIISDVLALSCEYTPSSGDRVDVLTISAEQMMSEDAAKAALERDLKLRYDRDTKTVTVKGRSGWAGTNGRDIAVLGIVDGQVLVVLQVRSSETDPAKLIADLIKIAETLPQD
jgi:hypothetical protein